MASNEEEDMEIDCELEMILADDVVDYSEPEDDIFPYDDTQVVSLGMDSSGSSLW